MAETNAAMGQRLRELRLRRGLQQSEVARRLKISPAYLSLIEKGKRVVQLPLLFQALELYGVAVEEFMTSLGERRVDDGLARLLDDPLLRSLNLSEEDLASISAEPRMAATITALFNLYKNTRGQLEHVMTSLAQREQQADEGSTRFDYNPYDEVTDFLEQNHNWFGQLEERAQQFRRDCAFGRRVTSDDLERGLLDQVGVRVHRIPERSDSSVIRTWNAEARVLTVSADLFEQRLKFQKLHRPILEGYRGQHGETRKLIKIHLANYFAGALLLPYPEFYRDVMSTRYDVELLAQLFESSYETVAHRMCNLADPRRRGVPMHFLRVDVAGNISKRYSGDGIRFPHQGGSCPKMAVHLAFLTPSVIGKQYSAFPDGSTYFCFAKVVSEPQQGSLVKGTTYSIGLGTHADNAKRFAYADDLPFADPKKMAVPVGTTCRFCERTDCNMRSAPSYKFAFRVDEYTKKDNFFSPLVSGDAGADVQKPARRKPTA